MLGAANQPTARETERGTCREIEKEGDAYLLGGGRWCGEDEGGGGEEDEEEEEEEQEGRDGWPW